MAKCLHSASHQLKPINWQILPHCWEKWQGMVLDKYPTMLAKFTTRLGKSASITALIPHFNFPFLRLFCASFVANTTRKFVRMQKVSHICGNFVDCPMIFARVFQHIAFEPCTQGGERYEDAFSRLGLLIVC